MELPSPPVNFTGSVPSGNATNTVIELTLADALTFGLKRNLGLVLSGEDATAERAARLQELSKLLPHVTSRIAESEQQVNLAAFGITPPPRTPKVVGPFSLSDAGAYASGPLLDLSQLNSERSAASSERAAQFSIADARETVTLVIANLYLRALASESQVAAAKSQLQTAQALYDQALTMRNAGMVAGIDVLRSQVQVQARRQQVLFLTNQLAEQELDLARAIGLPAGQQFRLATKMTYAPLPPVALDKALADAYANRSDYKRAQALVRSAEQSRKAAADEALPTLNVDGNYGDIGQRFSHSHGTFTAEGALNIPIFQGGKVRADVMQKDALLNERKAQLEDLRGQIDADVRRAFLDVQSAADQVEVTQTELEIANEALAQSRDRFAAGVADNLEVVQAQEAVANANQAYIASVYAHNIAKASLARAAGVAEKSIKQFLQGEQR
jgi:outer membrane protein TolC